MDNDTIDRVKLLVRWWQRPIGRDEKAIRKTMSLMPEDAYRDLLALKRCVDEIPETPKDLDEIFVLSRGIGQRGDCIRLKDLAVTGNDLINQGMKPGKAMGRALNFLLDRVIEDPEKNERETLLAELRAEGYL